MEQWKTSGSLSEVLHTLFGNAGRAEYFGWRLPVIEDIKHNWRNITRAFVQSYNVQAQEYIAALGTSQLIVLKFPPNGPWAEKVLIVN
jgi:hypothetical protein